MTREQMIDDMPRCDGCGAPACELHARNCPRRLEWLLDMAVRRVIHHCDIALPHNVEEAYWPCWFVVAVRREFRSIEAEARAQSGGVR